MLDIEKRAWNLLIKAGLNPSRWLYKSTTSVVSYHEHIFKNIQNGQKLILVDPAQKEEECPKKTKSFTLQESSASEPRAN